LSITESASMAARIPLEFGADAASARAVITAVLAKSASIPSLIELGIGFPPSPEGAMEKKRREGMDVPTGSSSCPATVATVVVVQARGLPQAERPFRIPSRSRRSAAFSASSRHFDLNGEAKTVRTKHSSAIIMH
jgi:hypothetical protein